MSHKDFRLLSSRIKNFKGIRDATLDPWPSGVVGVIGRSARNLGSNGSGKTTLLSSIMANLWGAGSIGLSQQECTPIGSKDKPDLDFTYQLGPNTLRVHRKFGSALNVYVDGQDLTSTMSLNEAQRTLEGILGVSQSQFSYLFYQNQIGPETFSDMSDSDKKDFLASFFDLSFLDRIRDKAKEGLRNIDLKSDEYKNTLATLSANIQSTNALIEEKNRNTENAKRKLFDIDQKLSDLPSDEQLQSKISGDTKATRASARSLVLSIRQSREEIIKTKNQKKDLGLRITEIESDREEVSGVLHKRKSEKVALEESMQNHMRAVGEIEGKMHGLLFQLEKTQKVLVISGDVCPTCGQDIRDVDALNKKLQDSVKESVDSIQGELSAHRNQLQVHKASMQGLKEEIGRNDSPDVNGKTVDSLNQEISNLKNDIKLADANISAHNKDLLRFSESLRSILGSRHRQIDDLREKRKIVKEGLLVRRNELESELKLEKDGLELLALNLHEYELGREKASQDMDRLNNEAELLSEIKGMTNKEGFVSYVLEQLLWEIESTSNSFLRNITNSQGFSVLISSKQDMKSKDRSVRKIGVEVQNSNGEKVGLNSLSGGEGLALKLMVDDAVRFVLAKKIGISPKFRVMDEQMGFLDQQSKETVMSHIESNFGDVSFYIVDHASEINASLENSINITKDMNGEITLD